MLPLIALAFIAIPIVEIAVLIKVGGAIGAWNTIALVILTAIAGTALLRAQGLATLARVQDSLARDIFPAHALFDGACLLVAGALLLTPGFVTDALGLALFLPPVRGLLRRLIWHRLQGRAGARIWVNGEEAGPRGPGGPDPGPGGPAPTIEGEWREVDPPADSRRGRGDGNGEDGGGR
jgi:UPF0716 protein FxsA